MTGGAFNSIGAKTLPPALVVTLSSPAWAIPTLQCFYPKRTSLGLKRCRVEYQRNRSVIKEGIILIVMILPVIKALPKTEASSLQEVNIDV